MKRRPPKKTSLKQQLALALAVSLWIAGSGVASAAVGLYLNIEDENTLYKNDDQGPAPAQADDVEAIKTATGAKAITPSGKTLSITGGNNWIEWNLYGGKGTNHDAIGYTLNLTNVSPGSAVAAYGGYVDDNDKKAERNTVNIDNSSVNDVCGGWAITSTGNATKNIVNLTNSKVIGLGVCGGRSQNGDATGNQVTIANSTVTITNITSNSGVYGGFAAYGDATGNQVTITNSTITNSTGTGNVYGGKAGNGKNATNNTVTFNGAIIDADLYGGSGGSDNVTGNTLNISGENNVGKNGTGTIQNFETINILSAAWGKPVLTLNGTGIEENANSTKAAIDAKKLTFANPETITHNDSMSLITCGNTATITADLVNTTATQTYTVNPIADKTNKGFTINGALTGNLALNGAKTALTYKVSANQATKVTFGAPVAWRDGETYCDLSGNGYQFTIGDYTSIDAGGLTFTGMAPVTVDPTGQSMTLLANAAGAENIPAASITQPTAAPIMAVNMDTQGVKLTATATGSVGVATNTVKYTINKVALTGVDLTAWDGTQTAEVPDKWAAAGDLNVDTTINKLPTIRTDILKATGGLFANANYTGAHQYTEGEITPVTENGVTLTGRKYGGVTATAANTTLTYFPETMDVNAISFGVMTWGTARDASAAGYVYAADTTVNAQGLSFANPETLSAGETTLLKANETLKNMTVNVPKEVSYTGRLVASGVTMDGVINGNIGRSGSNIVYTATANTATSLTFTNVDWLNSGALVTLPNVTFTNDTLVNTENIHFDLTNAKKTSLKKDDTMILVSGYNATALAKTENSTTFKVGTDTKAYKGKPELADGNLIFRVEEDTGGQPEPPKPEKDESHNAVMGAEVGMAALSAGNDFIGTATEGLSLASNIGADGVSSYANMGGGSIRQETGSHVDTHTWNAIIALGHQNKKEHGTTEYGAFFEYGSGNYTTFNDAGERGDGSMHYTGGGLLAKWTAKHGFYVEGSLRVGTVHDDARNVLRDPNTNIPYSYETNAGYWGAHLGLGKEIALANGDAVDVYGKFFYNRRNGVDFTAGADNYDLDAVTSEVLRIGARYIVKRSKWNFYAGAAYEHELDGKATGKVNGAPIQGADVGGGSFRGELGATLKPENSPWSLDLNVTAFAGKKQGFTGGVSVAFMF